MKRTHGKIRQTIGCKLIDEVGRLACRTDVEKHANIPLIEREANASHIEDLWNASDDMTTKQAVSYLKHGAEMERILRKAQNVLDAKDRDLILADLAIVLVDTDRLLAKLEVE